METPAPALLTTNELAARLGVHPVTVAQWRVKGIGPRYITVGQRSIRYKDSDVATWIASRERTSTATSAQPPRAA